MLDDEIGTMLVVDNFSEARLDLLRDVEVVEDGHLARVALHNAHFLGSYERDVVSYFFVDVVVVHVNALIRRVEQVAQKSHSSSRFLEHQLWTLLCLLDFLDDFLPAASEHFQLSIEFSYTLAFGYGSDDDSAVLRLDAVDELFQAGSLFSAFDFRRY